MSRDVVYWDAAAFLGYFNEEAENVEECQCVLAEADAGKIMIVTSALTIAEVIYAKGFGKLDASKRDMVRDFFRSEFIVIRNVTREIAEVAREVVWDHAIKPKDAIHVATAAQAKIKELHTFDVGLIGKSGVLILDHSLTIKRPHAVHQPDLLDESAEDEQE